MSITFSKRVASLLVCFFWALVLARPAEAGIFTNFTSLDGSDEFAMQSIFDPVGAVAINTNTQQELGGTGVLIDPYWVLTPGHVLTSSGTTLYDGFGFTMRRDLFDPTHDVVAVDQVFLHPTFNDDDPAGTGNDIALMRLAQPITDVAPANLFWGDDSDFINERFVTAGYGLPGVWPDEPTVADDFDGLLRGGENVVEGFGDPSGIADNHALSFLTTGATGLDFEWQGYDFDSGAPWLVDNNGSWDVFAITTTRVSSLETAALRTSLYGDFIGNTMQTNAVPEPGTFVLFASGMLGLLTRQACRSRRRKRTS